MIDLFLMGTEKYGWLALGAFYLIFEILVPLLKKRMQAQKNRNAPQPAPPQPLPRAAPPAASSSELQPQPRPVRPAPLPPRRRRRQPQPTPQPAATPTAATPVILQLTSSAYQPFLDLPDIAPVAQVEGIHERIAAAASRSDYPASLDLLHHEIVTTLLHGVPGLRPDAVVAAGLEAGIGDIRSIEELVQASDRLAVGWLDTAFADAVGMALLGAPYAVLRIRRLARGGQTHTLTLQNTGSRALSVNAPLRIIGPAYLAAFQALNLRAGGVDLKSLLAEYGALDGPVRLELAGFGRPIHFDLDPGPAIEATERMLTGIMQAKMPALDGTTLAALSRTQDLSKMQEIAAREQDAWISRGVLGPSTGLARLMTLLLLVPHESPARLRAMASGQAGGGRARGPAARPDEVGLTLTPTALVEAIVFGAILPRHGGR